MKSLYNQLKKEDEQSYISSMNEFLKTINQNRKKIIELSQQNPELYQSIINMINSIVSFLKLKQENDYDEFKDKGDEVRHDEFDREQYEHRKQDESNYSSAKEDANKDYKDRYDDSNKGGEGDEDMWTRVGLLTLEDQDKLLGEDYKEHKNYQEDEEGESDRRYRRYEDYEGYGDEEYKDDEEYGDEKYKDYARYDEDEMNKKYEDVDELPPEYRDYAIVDEHLMRMLHHKRRPLQIE